MRLSDKVRNSIRPMPTSHPVYDGDSKYTRIHKRLLEPTSSAQSRTLSAGRVDGVNRQADDAGAAETPSCWQPELLRASR